MKSKIWPRRPRKWPLDLSDLGRGSVNFFKNYIFEISASSWEKWAIARPCSQNFHLICPQRRCDLQYRSDKIWGYKFTPWTPRFPPPLREKPSQQLGNQQKLLIDMYCVDLLYQKCKMYILLLRKKHSVNCSIKEIFIIHAFYDKIFVKKRVQWFL